MSRRRFISSRHDFAEIEEDVRQGLLEALPALATKRNWKTEELQQFAVAMFARPLRDCSARELAAMIADFRNHHSKDEGES